MDYLHKLYFFDPLKTQVKREFYVSESSIDFISWYKQGTAEGTLLRMSFQSDKVINHIVEGVPENVNQIAFDGLFFKCTALHVDDSTGGMKSFSIWINPGNIANIYTLQPDCTELFFKSGKMILIKNSVNELIKNLLEHKAKIKERKKIKYGKKD